MEYKNPDMLRSELQSQIDALTDEKALAILRILHQSQIEEH